MIHTDSIKTRHIQGPVSYKIDAQSNVSSKGRKYSGRIIKSLAGAIRKEGSQIYKDVIFY